MNKNGNCLQKDFSKGLRWEFEEVKMTLKVWFKIWPKIGKSSPGYNG